MPVIKPNKWSEGGEKRIPKTTMREFSLAEARVRSLAQSTQRNGFLIWSPFGAVVFEAPVQRLEAIHVREAGTVTKDSIKRLIAEFQTLYRELQSGVPEETAVS